MLFHAPNFLFVFLPLTLLGYVLAKRIGEADLDTLYRLLADLPERLERTRR